MKVSFTITPRPYTKEELDRLNGVRALEFGRPDVCPFCKAKKIELFSFNGYPQNYSQAVDAHLNHNTVSYDKYEIRSMKCRSCGKEFVIDWSSGFPKPLRDTSKSFIFFSQFVQGL